MVFTDNLTPLSPLQPEKLRSIQSKLYLERGVKNEGAKGKRKSLSCLPLLKGDVNTRKRLWEGCKVIKSLVVSLCEREKHPGKCLTGIIRGASKRGHDPSFFFSPSLTKEQTVNYDIPV